MDWQAAVADTGTARCRGAASVPLATCIMQRSLSRAAEIATFQVANTRSCCCEFWGVGPFGCLKGSMPHLTQLPREWDQGFAGRTVISLMMRRRVLDVVPATVVLTIVFILSRSLPTYCSDEQW